MQQASKPYHDIPLTRRGVVDALLADLQDDEERRQFRALSDFLGAVLHYEFHARLERLKQAYEPFDPDRESPDEELTCEEQAARAERIESGLVDILERGNYRRLGMAEIEYAMREQSLFPIHVQIDLDVYEQLLVFARGESVRSARVKKWFGLRSRRIDVVTYDRICMYLRFKERDALAPTQRKRLVCNPGVTLLKLFRNIPKADLEMLFPNTELKMRWLDRLLIGVPAVLGGVPVLLKLAPVLFAFAILIGLERGEVNLASIVAGLSGLVGLGLFLFRQWDKFKSRKLLFLRTLSENLYFLNIDNNEGVITRLVDEAEEEEHKEALLAYSFLRAEPGLDAAKLDARIEQWLGEHCQAPVDFQIDDALSELERLELARRREDGGYEVVDLGEALARLDKRWDAFFQY